MMTELEFLDRFQRQPNGVWACTKPINVKGPEDLLSSAKRQALVPEPCLWGSISPRNSIKWPRSMDLLSLTQGMRAAKLPRHRPT